MVPASGMIKITIGRILTSLFFMTVGTVGIFEYFGEYDFSAESPIGFFILNLFVVAIGIYGFIFALKEKKGQRNE